MARTKEEAAKYARIWRSKNPEKQKAHVEKWRSKNQKSYRKYQKKWRKKYGAAAQRKWCLKHPEAKLATVLKWLAKNPGYRKKYDAALKRKLDRRIRRLRIYGLTLAAFDAMLKKQRGCCAVCRNPFTSLPYRQNPSVDHCHSTGKIRGLLCHGCNNMLGAAKDSVAILARGIQYLNEHKAENGLHK